MKRIYAINKDHQGLNVRLFEFIRKLDDNKALVRDVVSGEEMVKERNEIIILTNAEQIKRVQRRTSIKVSFLSSQLKQYIAYNDILKELRNE